MAIGTEHLKYLDLGNYLAAGTSLVKFYKAFKVERPKGNLPYEWFDSLDKLQAPSLPQRTQENREAVDWGKYPTNDLYYSLLKGKTISNEEVDDCKKVWVNQNIKNFGDYVRCYNGLDVMGLVEGIGKWVKFAISKNGMKQIFKAPKEGQYLLHLVKNTAIFTKWFKMELLAERP